MKRRGQATLELLILLAAMFAFLALWMPVAFKVKSGFEDAVAHQYVKLAEADLEHACRSVEEMGSGSQREVEVNLVRPARIDACNQALNLESGKSLVQVKNEAGTVRLDGALSRP